MFHKITNLVWGYYCFCFFLRFFSIQNMFVCSISHGSLIGKRKTNFFVVVPFFFFIIILSFIFSNNARECFIFIFLLNKNLSPPLPPKIINFSYCGIVCNWFFFLVFFFLLLFSSLFESLNSPPSPLHYSEILSSYFLICRVLLLSLFFLEGRFLFIDIIRDVSHFLSFFFQKKKKQQQKDLN